MEWLILGLVVVLSLAFEAVYYSNNTKILGYSIGAVYTLVNLIIVILFGVHIYNAHGPSSASEFTTGFVIEKMLSVDNIVVIKVILNTFNIPKNHYSKLLMYAIWGIVVLRILLIYCGIVIISEFEWLIYVLGVVLMLTGVKLWISAKKGKAGEKSKLLILLEKYLRVSPDENSSFFSYIKGSDGVQKLYISRFAACFIGLILFDFVFAIDSVAGILAISQDLFVIYSSNILSILGLRYLYFIISDLIHKYQYINYSMAAILIYIGFKPFLHIIPGAYYPSALESLMIVATILAMGILYSKIVKKSSDH